MRKGGWASRASASPPGYLDRVRNTVYTGILSAMKSRPDEVSLRSPLGAERRVPSWAAGLVAGLARDLPVVVTRDDVVDRLAEAGTDRDVESAIAELRRLGWLVGLAVHGAWAFIPPGQEEVVDPYIDLRAWRARDPAAMFRLAGAAAAWHLGYLDRAPSGRVPLWLPGGLRLPDGLRPVVSVTRIDWPPPAWAQLGPTAGLLARRGLDLVSWSTGLPAFGPDALVVQLAARPASFEPWSDLVAHLDALVADVDDGRLVTLLAGRSGSTWQRAAYLLHAGGQPQRGFDVLARRPPAAMPIARFARSEANAPAAGGLWIPEYRLVDELIGPTQQRIGKA